MAYDRLKGPLKLIAVVTGVLLASAVLAPVTSRVSAVSIRAHLQTAAHDWRDPRGVGLVRFRKDMFVRYGREWTTDSLRLLRVRDGWATTLIVFATVSTVAGHADVAIRQLTVFQWAQRIAGGLLTGVLIGIWRNPCSAVSCLPTCATGFFAVARCPA